MLYSWQFASSINAYENYPLEIKMHHIQLCVFTSASS
jgi:hypothetical protein